MLKDLRGKIITQVRDHKAFLKSNSQKLEIYQGNLLPYVDEIMRSSLSHEYYNAIKSRILPINILQRYITKVSTVYSKAPKRKAENESAKDFLNFYEKHLEINSSGSTADEYSNLFKGYAWEPYITNEGYPSLRELPFDRFIVISTSEKNPEQHDIFVKIVGSNAHNEDEILIFAYTNTEFDAFYMNGAEASEYLKDNLGLNVVGTIPFVYGKRQRNRLIPIQDTDMLAITKAIPVMLSDAAGAQMFQCFTILYGIDVSIENAKLSPNVLWSVKSDKESDKPASIGSIKPEADTDKVVDFVVNAFVMWLETKGIRVGSVGTVDGSNAASGLSKIIDEMDVHKLVCNSMDWFARDEKELWNKKMPKIHEYWVKNGMLSSELEDVPGIVVGDPKITVEFDKPKPMISRVEQIANCKAEKELGTMTQEQIIKELHPDYSPEYIEELLALGEKAVEEQKIEMTKGDLDATDEDGNKPTEKINPESKDGNS